MKRNMKATVNHQEIKGFFGQDIGYGTRWLFVESPKTRKSYSVAKVASDGTIVEIDAAPALSGIDNRQLAEALITAAQE